MNQTLRGRILLSLLMVCGAGWTLSAYFRHASTVRRQSEFQGHLDRQSHELMLVEQSRIADGEVWVGELHGSIDDLPEAVGTSQAIPPSSLLNQRRVSRVLPMPGSLFSVDTELHECHPGLPLCSTGGSIQIRHGRHSVCAVSIGLLQPSSVGGPASRYRIHWLPKEDGSELTSAEKLEIVRQLADGGQPATPEEFRRLMATAYSDEMQTGTEADRAEHLRSIISTIFSAIAASQDA